MKTLVELALPHTSSLKDCDSIVELGCGDSSVFEYLNIQGKTLFLESYDCDDRISVYYKQRSIENEALRNVTFRVGNVLELALESSVNVFIDSHLIHCLESREQIEIYLSNLFQGLVPGGVVVLETMCSNSAFKTAYKSQLIDGYLPSFKRHVLHSYEWEKLFMNCGFKIEVLKILKGYKLLFSDSNSDLNNEAALKSDPDVLQIILRK